MEADAASLRTETLSMSSGLIAEMSPSTPSMRMSGFELPIVPIPLTLIVVFDSPGCPLGLTMVTPGRRPCKPELTLEIGLADISSLSTIETDPVRFTFF